ncbi:hypothetical protein EP331_09740 [bacterium]|nr:MAG: hypothetical protein EP331_09740 [bacterium]
MIRIGFIALFCLISFLQVSAQLYRPSLNWFELKTEHFRIIFHDGNDSLAQVSAQLLEHHYSQTQSLTGGSLHNFPVVLNAYNDRSNGYVTPYNFRMEVEIPSIKGKVLNPRSGGWLENVLPHELIHAQHFSVVPQFGLGGLIYPFWPDAARSLHFSAPVGLHEGLAVHYESEILKHESGRGNFPFFTNQINSVFSGSGRWSFGQLLNSADQVRPFDRHYQGGYDFVHWVQETHGEKASRDIIDFVNRWPIFGFGVAYWYQMGQWPGSAYRDYQLEKLENERNRQAEIRDLPLVEGMRLDTKATGEALHRPQWLDDKNLLVYGQFYDFKAGFFALNTQTKTLKRLLTTNTVEDYKTDIKPDKTAFLFAGYDVHPILDNTFIANVYEFNLVTKTVQKLGSSSKTKDRVYSPIYVDDDVWAFQTKGTSNQLVSIKNNEIKLVLNPDNYMLVDMDYAEQTGIIALVANVNGTQGLWISKKEEINEVFERNPDIAFSSGSVFDPSWNEDGTRLLFTADYTGTANTYEYQPETGKVHQLTNSLFNAFEADYADNDSLIAVIVQHDNEQQVSVVQKSDFLQVEVDSSLWKHQQTNKKRYWQSTAESHKLFEKKPHYTQVSWLRPRAVLPIYETGTYGDKIGAILVGTDVLQRHTYTAEFSHQYEQAWYDITYRYSGFYPGFEVSVYKDPYLFPFNNNEVAVLAEQALTFGIPLSIHLENNINYSGLYIKPILKWMRFSFAHPITTGSTNFESLINNLAKGDNWSVGMSSSFYLKLLQRARDLQPSEGFILNTQLDMDVVDNTLYNLYNTNEKKRLGFIVGAYGFLSNPLFRNHSLRLGSQYLYQPKIPTYNTLDFVWDAGASMPFENSKQILELSTRYTFPFLYPEDGGVLIPWYLQNVYGVLFTRTHINEIKNSNTLLGVGLRYTSGFGNIRLDLGISYIYNTSNGTYGIWSGDF